ncbi:arf-GAP with dual PH domain-containing protein 1 isoform X4 [Apteryx rowi]|uniref:arf-GAP with dual PH domain-containing protein 1 isoform X4 n=1 Tax=Apteryx rowi TaxID=308060 RepID=UPI000E1DD34D|nr:arf-GAP with dual PH domain-containing protein 1 isoform X4 [Apteryx rowi]
MLFARCEKEQEQSEMGKYEGEGLVLSCLAQSTHAFGLLGFYVEAILLFPVSFLNHFIPGSQQFLSAAGYREGFLWKRGRDNGQFLSRKFVLSEREGALKYFNKNDAKEPKAIMKIEHLNATFQPAKIGNPHGLQITYLKDNSTRNIFVYHEDGKQTEGFKKRWFTMDDRRLMYFKDPLDAFARGEVFIGSKENSYKVLEGLPPSTQGNHWQHGITIVTPDRKFLFACETEDDQLEWITTFQKVISRPMLPQEYAGVFSHKAWRTNSSH